MKYLILTLIITTISLAQGQYAKGYIDMHGGKDDGMLTINKKGFAKNKTLETSNFLSKKEIKEETKKEKEDKKYK